MSDTLPGYLARAGAYVRALSGWPRFGFAFAAGLISALGFAPFNLFPALLLGFAMLVLLIDSTSAGPRPIRTAATLGWAFGFGQFLLGLHWIAYSFFIFPGTNEWQLPFLLFFFLLLALFQTVVCAAAARFWRPGPARIVLFAVLYGLAEWLRGHILTGFPWNIPAYGWGASLAVLQSTALFGAYTLSLLTVLFGASLAELFQAQPKWKLPAVLAGLFALFFIGGAVRLWISPTATVAGVELRLVQPNVPQVEKYQRRYTLRNWRRLIEQSGAPGHPTLIIWPEAAPPFLLDEQPLALQQIANITAKGQGLITGAIRREFAADNAVRYANSLFVFGKGGTLLATYDKSHLVPFGEYLPFEKTLTALGLKKLTGIDGGFAPGDGPKTYALPGVGMLTPLICYEILFPGEVVGVQRPDWLVNVTDDSWFGPWAGPRQHLLVARVRAIEEGLPVARAANTGISAIIDPFGRITQQLKLDEMGVLDGPLPAAIASTPFSRFGDWWFAVMVCAMVALTVVFFPKENDSHRAG
jgi:apolipoprotein N-acyltransferase